MKGAAKSKAYDIFTILVRIFFLSRGARCVSLCTAMEEMYVYAHANALMQALAHDAEK
jgi:hypothetical protein